MIDKRLLTDTIKVSKVNGLDDFGAKSFDAPITITPVRFDRSVRSVGSNNSKQRDKSGTIFIYPKYLSVVVDDSWIDAKVNDGFKDYIIKGYQPNSLNGKIFSYEIEVI